MTKVLVFVEGQTEETFVNVVLGPFLGAKSIYLIPVLARTKRTRDGRTFKGGIVSYRRQVRREILRLVGDSSAALITTMLDYYGLPQDFPGMPNLSAGSPREKVEQLEHAFRQDIGHQQRFLPFLTLHEFEALLFAQPEQFGSAFPDRRREAARLAEEVSRLPPEEINDGPDTHPAARIIRHLPNYRKPLHGPRIAKQIGLTIIREKCPHFDAWISHLETLPQEAQR